MTDRFRTFLYEVNRTELANIYRRALKTAYETQNDEQANVCLEIVDEIELNNLL